MVINFSISKFTNYRTGGNRVNTAIFKMKRFVAIFVVAVLSMSLVSCSSDDEETSFIESASFDTNLLFGSWKVHRWGTTEPILYDSMSDTRLHFYDDGTFSTSGGVFGSQRTTYKIKGNRIILNPSASTSDAYMYIDVQSIDEETAVFFLQSHASGETETICAECKKY